MIAFPGIDVIIDATGGPSAGITHLLASCRQGKHITMVNVEAAGMMSLPAIQRDCMDMNSRAWTCRDSATANPSRIRSSTSGFSSGN